MRMCMYAILSSTTSISSLCLTLHELLCKLREMGTIYGPLVIHYMIFLSLLSCLHRVFFLRI